MRRSVSVLLAVAMLFSLWSPVAGESGTDGADLAMSVYRGMYGNVEFRLPGPAERIREEDFDGAWTDSWQLMGYCGEDNAEFQLHMADISELIGYFREDSPDQPEEYARYQALMNYGFFIPSTFGAEITDASDPVIGGETGNITADFTFTYPDAPGEQYVGHFMLAGVKAVCLVMLSCPHTTAVTESMRFVPDGERDAFLAEKERPVFWGLYGLLMTFPGRPDPMSDGSMEALLFFTPDWGLLEVDYIPAGFRTDLPESELKEKLTEAAKEKMLPPYAADEVLDPVLSFPAEHTAQLDFRFRNGYYGMGEYSQAMLGRLYAGEHGVWYVYAPDDQTGRDFLDSMYLAGEAPPEGSGGDGGAELPEINGAVTLPLFRERLERLMIRKDSGFVWKPGNFRWSGPVFSGGKWLRAVYSADEDFGAALISLSGSGDDASVLEVRMLRFAYTDEGKEDWQAFCRLCALALRGDAEWREERLDPEHSQLKYDRAVLLPRGEIPLLTEDVPYPEDENVKDFPDENVTVGQFAERMRNLSDRELTRYSYQNGAWLFLLGEETGMVVYADSEAEDAAVKRIIVMGVGFDEDAAPLVVYGTYTAFAAMTDMAPEEFAALGFMLMETPMWDQLCDLWPLLCRGDVIASLQNGEQQGQEFPLGIVAGR